ncbi:hypothetical protein yc1106_02936 [Curvularia clavata]|uniref:Xylanolytic transcriptional activator regulatory domain-containing protein n=1 Tax=Curvularia clavata TaxID=95742 RepID=A0A9Q8Z4Q3_CURCL|nr:hypothetical protein yc1106_02936 [Curvularia clavata]
MDTSGGDQPAESWKSKRITKACDVCYEKKLLDRVDRLERLLAKTLEQKTSTSLPHDNLSDPSDSTTENREDDGSDEVRDISTPSSIEQPALGSLHFAGWRLGSINSSNGIPVFSEHGEQWIRSRTGEDVSLERITALRQTWRSMVRSDWGTSVNAISVNLPSNMPDRQVVEECLSLYRRSFYPPAGKHNSKCGAILADGASDIDSVLSTGDVGNTADIMYAVFKMMYHLVSGDLPNALIQDSVTTRIIFMLGAHTTTYPSCADASIVSASPSFRERYLMRNLFWLTYILDKELSLRTGQPPCLQDDHCDMSLPPAYVQQVYYQMMGCGPDMPYKCVPLFPGHPSLSIIKSKAYNALFSPRALRKADAEILKDIRELDDDLECWRLSIPLPYRPTVSFTRARLPTDVAVMPSVMMHLDYNHCVAAIHQATSRCRAWSFGSQDDLEGVGTSLELSIEASRSSLLYLQMTSHLLDENSFWYVYFPVFSCWIFANRSQDIEISHALTQCLRRMILFYPMSALLTLFYGILHRPRSPQSRRDLELLKDVPPMIRRIPISRWEKMENASRQIQAVDELVEELTTLAQRAIDKATQDNGDEAMQGLLLEN